MLGISLQVLTADNGIWLLPCSMGRFLLGSLQLAAGCTWELGSATAYVIFISSSFLFFFKNGETLHIRRLGRYSLVSVNGFSRIMKY
jgi:hypothetical protein